MQLNKREKSVRGRERESDSRKRSDIWISFNDKSKVKYERINDANEEKSLSSWLLLNIFWKIFPQYPSFNLGQRRKGYRLFSKCLIPAMNLIEKKKEKKIGIFEVQNQLKKRHYSLRSCWLLRYSQILRSCWMFLFECVIAASASKKIKLNEYRKALSISYF